MKGPTLVQTLLKKAKVERFDLLGVTDYKDNIIKTVWYWHKNECDRGWTAEQWRREGVCVCVRERERERIVANNTTDKGLSPKYANNSYNLTTKNKQPNWKTGGRPK